MVAEKDKSTDKSTDKSSDKSSAKAEESRIQDQVLDAIKRTQEATLKAVSAWSESVAKIAPKLPEMPKMPHIDSLPKPGEISETFFKFAQELMATEHEFVKRLLDALPGHDKSPDHDKSPE